MTPFEDQTKWNPSDIPYIALVNSSGIVGGFGDGTFKADGLANRAQASVMLYRYLSASEQNKIEITKEMLEYDMYTISDISVGDNVNDLIDKRGNPDRKSPSRRGFTWYIYNSDYHNFAQYGINEGKVVAIYTNSGNWESVFGIQPDLTQTEVYKLYKELDDESFNSFQYSNYETINLKNQTITLFYDYHNSQKIQAVFVTEPEYFIPSKEWDPKYIESVERQIFDMTNASRARHGLKPYSWNEKVALVARKHSEDMANREYYSHYSPEGRGPNERLLAGGVSPCGWGENIYSSPKDAISAHQGWMNSLGHRNNILNSTYLQQLGVGAAIDREGKPYYTQNMISVCR